MKFIGKLKDVTLTLPPAVGRQLMEGTLAVINQHMKEGKISQFYQSPGWNRTIVITEVNSAEEMFQNINAMPIANYMDMEIYPLVDGADAVKSYIEILKMAEQMMPK
jgi:muconolactone delta-isomerase